MNNASCEVTLKRITKISKGINRVLTGLAALLCVFWIVYILSSVALILGLKDSESIPSIEEVLIFGSYSLVIIILAFVFGRVFLDVANGESPFSFMQVKRLRNIAFLLLVYTILDAFLSTGFVSQINLGDLSFGYSAITSPGGAAFTLNIGALLASGFFWALSLIFKYGVLLQEFSDETL